MPLKSASLLLILFLAACTVPKSGISPLLEDPESGYRLGAMVTGGVVIDPALVRDRRLKLTLRNTTGNPLFSPSDLRRQISDSMLAKGYLPADGFDGFGVKLDINVIYAGHITSDLRTEFGELGAMVASRQANGDIVMGEKIGDIIGRYITENTYIVQAVVSVALRDRSDRNRRVVTFSRSARVETYDESLEAGYETWLSHSTIDVAVFAGGYIIAPEQVAALVRQRLSAILQDVI